MSYDNRIFNMNGESNEQLLLALRAVLIQKDSGVKAWSQHGRAGMLLHWCVADGTHELPTTNVGLSATDVLPLVSIWLASEAAKKAAEQNTGYDADPCDSDIHIYDGWRVYIPKYDEDGISHYSIICAIKPVCLWLGR